MSTSVTYFVRRHAMVFASLPRRTFRSSWCCSASNVSRVSLPQSCRFGHFAWGGSGWSLLTSFCGYLLASRDIRDACLHIPIFFMLAMFGCGRSTLPICHLSLLSVLRPGLHQGACPSPGSTSFSWKIHVVGYLDNFLLKDQFSLTLSANVHLTV